MAEQRVFFPLLLPNAGVGFLHKFLLFLKKSRWVWVSETKHTPRPFLYFETWKEGREDIARSLNTLLFIKKKKNSYRRDRTNTNIQANAPTLLSSTNTQEPNGPQGTAASPCTKTQWTFRGSQGSFPMDMTPNSSRFGATFPKNPTANLQNVEDLRTFAQTQMVKHLRIIPLHAPLYSRASSQTTFSYCLFGSK